MLVATAKLYLKKIVTRVSKSFWLRLLPAIRIQRSEVARDWWEGLRKRHQNAKA